MDTLLSGVFHMLKNLKIYSSLKRDYMIQCAINKYIATEVRPRKHYLSILSNKQDVFLSHFEYMLFTFQQSMFFFCELGL